MERDLTYKTDFFFQNFAQSTTGFVDRDFDLYIRDMDIP